MRHIKRSSVEPWIENVEETGCLKPAFKQNTNYGDQNDLDYVVDSVVITCTQLHIREINCTQ